MSKFKKMILISKNEYDSMKPSGIDKIFTGTENDEIKRMYATDFLNKKISQFKNIKSEQGIDQHKSLPKLYLDKGKLLLDILKQKINWNERGEIENIPNSNIEDILHFLIRNRKFVTKPFGFDAILPILKELNLSRELVSNPKAYKLINNNEISISPPLKRKKSSYLEWNLDGISD